jgi:hypothetical protein
MISLKWAFDFFATKKAPRGFEEVGQEEAGVAASSPDVFLGFFTY